MALRLRASALNAITRDAGGRRPALMSRQNFSSDPLEQGPARRLQLGDVSIEVQPQLMAANLAQVGASMIQSGLVSEAEIGTARRLLADPGFVANYPLLITAWGATPSGV